MTEMSGWVKLHRKAFNNPVITKDAHYFYLWCYLLTHAAHAPHKSMFNGTIVTLEPGQLITGRDKMARILRVHRSKIERIIKWFISSKTFLVASTNLLIFEGLPDFFGSGCSVSFGVSSVFINVII